MTRTCALFAITLLAIGCSQKPEATAPSITLPPAETPTTQPARPNPVVWSVIDDVAVRLESVRLQKPVMEVTVQPDQQERELDKIELMVWVKIENRSTTKSLDYRGVDHPVFGRTEPVVTDDRGNTYKMKVHHTSWGELKNRAPRGPVAPGASITEVICFEPPSADAGKLTLTLPALTERGEGTYKFEIPAAAWK